MQQLILVGLRNHNRRIDKQIQNEKGGLEKDRQDTIKQHKSSRTRQRPDIWRAGLRVALKSQEEDCSASAGIAYS